MHALFCLPRMVHYCVVPTCRCTNCSNKEGKNIKFYTLPFKDEQLLQIWLALICKCREVTICSRICSTHFIIGIKRATMIFLRYFLGKNTYTVLALIIRTF